MNPAELRGLYEDRYERILVPIAARLRDLLADYVSDCPRIDRVTTRAKSIDRFVAKALKQVGATPKYSDPLNQIQDQIGARIVTFYLSDVPTVEQAVERYFRPIEARNVEPDTEKEFGYVGKHYILFLPEDVVGDDEVPEAPKFFELQIKTLFQHAWSEAEHDLAYKPSSSLSKDQKRFIAFTAAQAWGADRIFDQLFTEFEEEKRSEI